MNIIAAMDQFDLSCLRDAATLVDSKLEILDENARASRDPDADGIYDRAEHLVGFGFVACQVYMTEAISLANRDKEKALNLGPQHTCGHSFATLVNAIANYWKHSPEWTDPLPRRSQRTVDIISALGVDVGDSYVAVNALSEIVRPHRYRIQFVVPFLAQWRQGLYSDA
jgi:hypothetical protein